jgi:endonuclease YncB( thermonuclease family)
MRRVAWIRGKIGAAVTGHPPATPTTRPASCFVFVLAAVTVAIGSAGASRPDQTLRGRVVHVNDGDTLEVLSEGRTARVRLDGIDAPERGQPYSRQALVQLRTLTLERDVLVQVRDVDRYGRLVARVAVDGRDVSEEMVTTGFAWHYARYSRDAKLAALEREARTARRGLWVEARPVPPWEYRGSTNGANTPSARAPAAPRAQPRAPSAAPAGPGYHGNVKSFVYHAPGCPDYNCPNCTRAFPTKQAAEAAGFRPHRACVK